MAIRETMLRINTRHRKTGDRKWFVTSFRYRKASVSAGSKVPLKQRTTIPVEARMQPYHRRVCTASVRQIFPAHFFLLSVRRICWYAVPRIFSAVLPMTRKKQIRLKDHSTGSLNGSVSSPGNVLIAGRVPRKNSTHRDSTDIRHGLPYIRLY